MSPGGEFLEARRDSVCSNTMVAFRRIGQLGADAAKIDLQIANGLLHPIQDKNSFPLEECRDDVAFAKIGEQVRTVGTFMVFGHVWRRPPFGSRSPRNLHIRQLPLLLQHIDGRPYSQLIEGVRLEFENCYMQGAMGDIPRGLIINIRPLAGIKRGCERVAERFRMPLNTNFPSHLISITRTLVFILLPCNRKTVGGLTFPCSGIDPPPRVDLHIHLRFWGSTSVRRTFDILRGC